MIGCVGEEAGGGMGHDFLIGSARYDKMRFGVRVLHSEKCCMGS